MTFFIKMEGLKEMQNDVRNAMDEDYWNEVVEETGKKAFKYAQDMCPVDTGKLRDSLKLEIDETNYIIGTDVRYASYNEFGSVYTPAGGVREPLVTTDTSGSTCYRPFVRPAIMKANKDARELFGKKWYEIWKDYI